VASALKSICYFFPLEVPFIVAGVTHKTSPAQISLLNLTSVLTKASPLKARNNYIYFLAGWVDNLFFLNNFALMATPVPFKYYIV
jgi:hypothetical protein